MDSSDSGDSFDTWEYYGADPYCSDDPFYDKCDDDDDSKGMIFQIEEELRIIRTSPIFYWDRQRIVWIGKFKNDLNPKCQFGKLPVYLIWYLFTFGNIKFSLEWKFKLGRVRFMKKVEILESRHDVEEVTQDFKKLTVNSEKKKKKKKRRKCKKGKKKNKGGKLKGKK